MSLGFYFKSYRELQKLAALNSLVTMVEMFFGTFLEGSLGMHSLPFGVSGIFWKVLKNALFF